MCVLLPLFCPFSCCGRPRLWAIGRLQKGDAAPIHVGDQAFDRYLFMSVYRYTYYVLLDWSRSSSREGSWYRRIEDLGGGFCSDILDFVYCLRDCR